MIKIPYGERDGKNGENIRYRMSEVRSPKYTEGYLQTTFTIKLRINHQKRVTLTLKY
jgi:hypothetical protein